MNLGIHLMFTYVPLQLQRPLSILGIDIKNLLYNICKFQFRLCDYEIVMYGSINV